MPTAVNIIIFYGETILLILRDNDKNIKNPNSWAIVSGGIEEGGEPHQAVERECQEEIGVVPHHKQHIYTLENGNEVYAGWLTDDEYGRVRLGEEGQELRFVSLDKLHTYTLSPRLREAVEHRFDLLKRLSQYGAQVK